MDRESPEVIAREMEQTRAALTEKVSALEQQVIGTIQDASQAVTNTVASVRTAVQDTLHSVKDTVHDSVHTVADTMKQSLDLPRQTRQYPWEMVGGAAALGFITGLLVFNRRERSLKERGSWAGTGAVRTEPSTDGRTFLTSHEPSASRQLSWVDELMERVGREAVKLGETALATATASLRETVEAELPKLISEGIPRFIGTQQGTQQTPNPRQESQPMSRTVGERANSFPDRQGTC